MARISIEQKKIFIILLVAILSLTVIIIHKFSGPTPITSIDYYGMPIGFRADLRQAENISVYPDDLRIYTAIWDENNENLTIVFANSSDNSLVLVEAYEIAFKLELAFDFFSFNANITGREINSYDNITADENNPVIALIPPSLANKTRLELKDNVIFIEGETKEEFELATIKFLMVVLDIKVD